MKCKLNYNKGFTLIEILLVVLIIAILTMIAVPKYLLATDRSNFARLQTYANDIANAYKIYYYQYDKYPSNIKDLAIDFSGEFVEVSKGNKEREYSCVVMKDNHCCISPAYSGYSNAAVVCNKNDFSYGYLKIFNIDISKKQNWQNELSEERIRKIYSLL